ncbi:MAG: fumarylacetoacetase [Burkholderiaceae bacterium]
MSYQLNETHDPSVTSWIDAANHREAQFPIQNLPIGVFRRAGSQENYRGGVAIGDQVVDLTALLSAGVFTGDALAAASAASQPALNDLMSLGRPVWSALRLGLSRMLRSGSKQQEAVTAALVPMSAVQMTVPAKIGDFTDMYTSVHHATNIGKLFRPDNPLMPNFKWLPVGYHGRASSIDVSGQRFHRPRGQIMPPGQTTPVFTECQRLDYELEIGIWVGRGNAIGEPVSLDEADDHIFGLCLLNDWSARDIQAWEYQPLGPFLAKNFASTISPWIVTMEALEPYRVAWTRPADDPQPLAYLESGDNRRRGGLDITIESWLQTNEMTGPNDAAKLSHSSFKHSYWTIGQMIAHHTVGGCNLQPGDLIGTGTQSGPQASEAAALIELTAGGKSPVTLPNGQTRTFLEDGDSVILKAWCALDGGPRIGFGECAGTVLPAR